ncbi:DUF354 domain-containing protein [Halomarina pelagica]|uniref:DUF354 domain-containing protein n=1 Tax=Halomarina pelagica TaxID=2961599 RepID=UPI0020C4DD84|nr:DUF354 domain-containing protein [Halomarina sp. BND7]
MRSTLAQPTVWIDLASPSHPFFFKAIADGLDLPTVVTAREKTETVPLAREAGFDCSVVGKDFDNQLARTFGVPLRTVQLSLKAPKADVSLSARNAMCVLASKVHGIPSIHYTDNDITYYQDAPLVEEAFNYFRAMATHHVVPAAFQTAELTDYGAAPETVHTYDGYKEDVAIAYFEPDDDFTDRLPFEDFIVVRPEAMGAAYIDIEESLVPGLLERAVDAGFNVVYLPRRPRDRRYAAEYPDDRVYAPERPLQGLQLAWHAQCVLTGSGTMAREAASMGKPAVSFFPHTMLSVDQQLVKEGRVFHSRDVGEIVDYLTGLDGGDVEPDLARAREVHAEVVEITDSIIEGCT